MGVKEGLNMNFKNAASRYGTRRLIAIAAVIAAAVLLNLLVGLMPDSLTKPDVSQHKLYTLSDVTETMMKDLDTPVTVYYYAEEGSEDAAVSLLLSRYKDLNSRLTVKKVDPVAQPDFIGQYTEEEVPNGSLVVESDSRAIIVSYHDLYYYEVYVEGNYLGNCPMQDYSYLAFRIQLEYNMVPSAVPAMNAEGAISGAISYVTGTDEEPTALPIDSKQLQVEALTIPSLAGNVWSGVIIGVLPLAFIVAGVAVTLKRRKG